MSYNGSAVIAMVGHNCVAICSDLRLGVPQQTLATDFQKVLVLSGWLGVGAYAVHWTGSSRAPSRAAWTKHSACRSFEHCSHG